MFIQRSTKEANLHVTWTSSIRNMCAYVRASMHFFSLRQVDGFSILFVNCLSFNLRIQHVKDVVLCLCTIIILNLFFFFSKEKLLNCKSRRNFNFHWKSTVPTQATSWFGNFFSFLPLYLPMEFISIDIVDKINKQTAMNLMLPTSNFTKHTNGRIEYTSLKLMNNCICFQFSSWDFFHLSIQSKQMDKEMYI